ncbi:type II toxin-antitoxin system HicA family toxin [Methanospirillum stamsii]|nr:type II toxin-antitoxin system HicA family toxin [Methanospirillum stamsii]
MSIIPSISTRDLVKKLRKAGYEFDRHAKGSHEI